MQQQNALSSVEWAEAINAVASSYGADRDASPTVRQLLQAPKESQLAPTAVRGGLAPWQIRKLVALVETNLDKPIRSSDLAAAVRLTPCHFSRAFRTSFGESPSQYVMKQRIGRSKRLMLSTDSPLSQIALECGFADQAHFCRLFRRVAGDSPRAWRRSYLDPRSFDRPISAGSSRLM
ncbi:MAG TPA: AraC family transcriptional regulator [Burkholderiales bacterium]|nr:AraC family transcriptional regulator [Burkholderiales bacterium]